MAGLTSRGLVTLRYSEVVDNISQYLFQNLSQKLNISEDSDLGILLAAICTEIADLWEATSAVNDSTRIDKAEGFSLDDLVGLNGIYRYIAMPTSGVAEFTGDVGTEVPSTTTLRTTTGAIYYPKATFTISTTSCVETNVSINNLRAGESYIIIIDNVEYSYTALTGDTKLTVLQNLTKLINSGLIAVATLDSSNLSMNIAKDKGDINKRTQSMVVTTTTYMSFGKTTVLQSVESEDNGSIAGFAETLLYIDSPVSGLDSVYNRYDFTLGRGRETDEELRERYYGSLTVTGIGTLDAIVAAVKKLSGVSACQGVENDTEVMDNTTGLPAKSFQIVVVGGNNNEVAQAIWDTKPAGIRAFGTVVGTAYDDNGYDHKVYFSRPDPRYVFVKVRYYIDSEETLSVQETALPDAIKSAILKYGATLSVGGDVVPNRILRYIYENVTGIVVDSITVALAVNQQTPPATGDYTSDRLKISSTQYTVWETNQFTTTAIDEPD